jgi:hypothetical protein
MKRSVAILLLVICFGSGAAAQDRNEFRRFDINFNVLSYARQGSTDQYGGTLGFTVHVNQRWSVVADVGIHETSDGLETTTYRFGPKITHRMSPRWSAFGQFLAGGTHLSIPDLGAFSPTANGFSMLAGGGVDFGIRRWFAIRVVEGGYSGMHVNTPGGGWSNGARVSGGIVFRFGE